MEIGCEVEERILPCDRHFGGLVSSCILDRCRGRDGTDSQSSAKLSDLNSEIDKLMISSYAVFNPARVLI